MPTYLWSGKTGSGEEKAERVAAATAQEAREILEKRGWKDLRLHTDEIGDFVKQQVEAVSDPDKALQCHRQAVAEATDKATPSIDLAACLVQRFNYPAEAREILAVAEKSPLTETALPHVSAVRGVIALRQNDFTTANRLLLEALAGFEKNAGRRRYIFEPSILLTQGYLAVANAALGNKQAAREYFAKSEKYLAVIRMDEVIAMYESHG